MINFLRLFILTVALLSSYHIGLGQDLTSSSDTTGYQQAQQLLELSRQERLILQQQAELQKIELVAAEDRQQILLVTMAFSVLIIGILAYMVIRARQSSKIIEEQNLVLEKQQRNLQHAQRELKKTLRIAQDSSNRLQKSNDQLRQMQSQLIQSEKMSSLGQLTAGIVHEINNPVNFVKGGIEMVEKNLAIVIDLFAELKESEVTGDKASRSIDEIRKEIDEELQYNQEIVPQILKDVKFGTARISEIVNGLRIFSRQGDSTPSVVKLHELIDSALLIMRNKYIDVAELEKRYDESIEEIECFPGLLNQVIVNMISNAVDALKSKGKIEIETHNAGEFIEIKITDNGSGIEAEHLEHIFDPFFTTKEVGKGTGIGLSISYSIIQKHGGTIEVDSEPGLFTSFSILLKKKLDQEDLIRERVVSEEGASIESDGFFPN